MFVALSLAKPPSYALESDDAAIWAAMPAALRDELRDYYRRVYKKRDAPDRERLEMPCLWFDEETGRCRHYEHRPTACRDFEPGSLSCVEHREQRGIAGPHPTPRPGYEGD
jgi:Fe-S-cluster containining protein